MQSETTDPRFTDRALMGRVWWWLVIGPAVRLAELQGWLIDRRNERNGL